MYGVIFLFPFKRLTDDVIKIFLFCPKIENFNMEEEEKKKSF